MAAHLANDHSIHLNSATKDVKQRKLTDVFFGAPAKKSRVEKKSEAQNILNRRFALWICCDLMPFSIVEKKGFRDLWKETKQDAGELPSRTTVAAGALDETYICFKNRLIEVLARAPKFATMTFDLWTDNHKRISYITTTYHYMCDWEIKTFVLKTSAFGYSSASGENIKHHIECTLKEFNLTEKKITAVTDGGTNVIKACRLLNMFRMNCIAHSIHLLIMFDLIKHPEMKDFFKKFLRRLREVHHALIFKYRELKLYDDERKQKHFLDAVKDAADMGRVHTF